jgi:spoIIIJ-associated protein
MDQNIEQSRQWLEQLLQLIDIPAEVKVDQRYKIEEDPSDWLIIDETSLTPEQVDLFIGLRGDNLDAVQYLANSILNIGVEEGDHHSITIEINGYRVRRQAELKILADTVAQKVRMTGVPEEIHSLSSAERRQVHHFLSRSNDIYTESVGHEPDRRLIVRLR